MSAIQNFINNITPSNYFITKSMEITKVSYSGTLWYTKKYLVFKGGKIKIESSYPQFSYPILGKIPLSVSVDASQSETRVKEITVKLKVSKREKTKKRKKMKKKEEKKEKQIKIMI